MTINLFIKRQMQLGNHRNKNFPSPVTLTEEAFYLINFVLIKMITICSYNGGNSFAPFVVYTFEKSGAITLF